MKNTNYLLIILTAGVLALAGCGKSNEQPAPPPPAGMIDFGALQRAFPNPTPEVAASLQKLRFTARYRQFDAAMVELDKLAQLPNLTDEQKKAVNDAIEQIKKTVSAMPATPAQ